MSPLVGFHSRRAGQAGPSAFHGQNLFVRLRHGVLVLAGLGCVLPLSPQARSHLGRDTRGGLGAAAGRRAARAGADGVATRADRDRRAAERRLALDRADGSRASGWRVHVRLDREPPRPRHAQRRPRPARVPAPGGGRHDRLREEPDAGRAGRARAGARVAIRGRQLGLDVRPRRSRRRHEADQPQPLQAADPRVRVSGCSSWSRRRWSWSGRCSRASSGGPRSSRHAAGEASRIRSRPSRIRSSPNSNSLGASGSGSPMCWCACSTT